LRPHYRALNRFFATFGCHGLTASGLLFRTRSRNKIIRSLRDAITAQPGDCRELLESALRRAERLSESLASAPAKLGSKGGKETAKRGSEYFRQLAAMRKTKAGGRPAKSEQ
jgi:hypothetical protein